MSDSSVSTSASHTAVSTQDLVDQNGQVKWFDARKGFGFIVGPEGQDIFVHFSCIQQAEGFRTLRDGEAVVYSAAKGPKGWAASAVRAAREGGEAAPPQD
jgi:CspA family cold shock protein